MLRLGWLCLLCVLCGLGMWQQFGDGAKMARPAARTAEPSEWTMVLSGLGLVSLGLSRKTRLNVEVMPREEEKKP